MQIIHIRPFNFLNRLLVFAETCVTAVEAEVGLCMIK